jgi:hypothetical protein
MTRDPQTLVEELLEHCLGAGLPTQALLNTGRFPEGWVARYLDLAEAAYRQYAEVPLWPRELAASAYLVSVYCEKRYRDWLQGGGAPDPETEAALRQVRWAGDQMLFGWFGDRLGEWSRTPKWPPKSRRVLCARPCFLIRV